MYGARWIWLAAAGVACATSLGREVEECPRGTATRPPLTTECVDSDEGWQYLSRAGTLLGDELMSWRAHPGHARLRVYFAADASVESVCVGEVEGARIARRVPAAARQLRRLPSAPLCFAGHRAEFAWESPTVTETEIESAKRACHGYAEPPMRALHFCHLAQDCTYEEVLRLRDEADRKLASCVLRDLPLTVQIDGTGEGIAFLPFDHDDPDPEEAARALESCSVVRDRASGLECMARYGWRPVEVE